ncbi:MAG: CotH kinase family protein, partial [Verrucomicrobiae bacterium]|nr:CotH kinase family protein [Verrucomicrobiae bacterium]
IHPDGTPGFGVDAGLRIRGAFSRTDGNPKHSFRLFFRSEYGTGRLNYPLFGEEGVDQFDNVDLRTSQNYSWAFEGSEKNTMIRDVFSRDTQRDMGRPYTRSRYYHLYLNGQYWGIYQTQERVDADYAESYLGGDKRDYDVIKNDSSGSRALEASAGTMEAYRRLYDAAVAGFAPDEAYRRILGQLPDGSPDPNGEQLLDAGNLMDYMVCTYYTGDPDAPVSCWAHFSNNIFAAYNRAAPAGFIWFRHDAEHSLGANGGELASRLLTDPTDRSIGQNWRDFNPAWLHVQLTANEEYRLQFADRVVRHFYNDGVLSVSRNIDRWMQRAAQIDLAMVAESARWGDAKRRNPRTRNDWLAERDYLLNQFFPGRNETVVNRMRSVGMFPSQAIVFLSRTTGEVDRGASVTLSQENGTPGTIYFTLDGSDPRFWGGGVNPVAIIYEPGVTAITLQETTTLKARVRTGDSWGALTEARYSVGLGGLVINELMASNQTTLEDPEEPGEFPDWIELHNRSDATVDLGGLYLSDDPLEPDKWQFAAGVMIEAGGFLLIYADDDGTQGAAHTNFQLSRNGETLLLVDRDGTTILDSVTFGAQLEDVSYGRFPDAGDTWGFHRPATPGSANGEPVDPGANGVRILGFTLDGAGKIALEWLGCTGCPYEVQWAGDLTGAWTGIKSVTAAGAVVRVEFAMPAEAPRAFFRVAGGP